MTRHLVLWIASGVSLPKVQQPASATFYHSTLKIQSYWCFSLSCGFQLSLPPCAFNLSINYKKERSHYFQSQRPSQSNSRADNEADNGYWPFHCRKFCNLRLKNKYIWIWSILDISKPGPNFWLHAEEFLHCFHAAIIIFILLCYFRRQDLSWVTLVERYSNGTAKRFLLYSISYFGLTS